MRCSRIGAALAAASLVALGLAAGAAPQPGLRFVSAADVRPELLLAPPPAEGSAASVAELAEVRRISRQATPAEYARAKWDSDHEDATMFAGVFGAGYDLKALPATAKMMGEVRNDEAIAAALAKDHFRRNRPWVLDPALRTCGRSDGPRTSYPSGHATMGFAMAVVLARAAPSRAPQLLARAREYANERLVCAVHFRSDVAAGETLGTAVAVMMLRSPDFQADIAAAAAELRAAHLAPS